MEATLRVYDETPGIEARPAVKLRVAVVATMFLPLGFLTGLLGVNVGGIPMTQNPWGIGIVCAVLLLIGIVEVWLFRRLKWL